MKHIYISVMCIAIIIVYTIFSFYYIQDFTLDMEQRIKTQEANEYSLSAIEEISEILTHKENMLLFMISKEHFDLLEEYTVNLKYAVEFADEQGIKTYRTLFLNLLKDIEMPNKSPI